jgi:uncharacterized membrane protein HdeD (DUF308 family)
MSTEVLALRWGSVVAAGAAMILVGVLSVAFADAAGQALIAFLGWLLLLGGAVQLLGAIRVRAWRGGLMTLLVALLRVATGVLFIAAPRAWASAIVTLVGLYFLVDGAFRVLLAFQARPAPGWGYVLTGGSAALLLGLLMVLELSGDGAFVVGLLFGIHLLFDGWATLMLAAAARAARR